MKKIIKIVLLCLFLIMLVFVVKWLFLDKKHAVEVQPTLSSIDAAQPIASSNEEYSSALKLNELRSVSQQDTRVDGRLREDALGQLIVERSVRDVFDYFMTAAGEMPLSKIIANIHRYIDAHLSVTAADQAKVLLKQYIDLEAALDDYYSSLTIHPQDLEGSAQLAHWRNLLDKRIALREEYLAGAAEQFFADEEAYDYFTLERMQLETLSLSAEQKQQHIEQLTSQLPEKLQLVVRAQQQAQGLEQQDEAWAQLPEQARFAMREQQYGTASAKRLAALDIKRTQWNQRINDYIEKKNALKQSMNSDSPAYAAAVKQLQQRLFDDKEQLRLSAYER